MKVYCEYLYLMIGQIASVIEEAWGADGVYLGIHIDYQAIQKLQVRQLAYLLFPQLTTSIAGTHARGYQVGHRCRSEAQDQRRSELYSSLENLTDLIILGHSPSNLQTTDSHRNKSAGGGKVLSIEELEACTTWCYCKGIKS
jgi:hypothetical protein